MPSLPFKSVPLVSLSVLTLICTLIAAPATSQTTHDGDTGVLVDLPLPAVAPIDLTCADGQVDLNHSAAASLSTALDVDADVADRIVASRPHNGPEDLLVVDGFGPGDLRHLDRERVCASPVLVDGQSVPAVSAEFCLPNDERVDVNVAPAETIAEVFPGNGKGRMRTAERIVDRADVLPFPTLDHVRAVAGIGPHDRIVDQLCLTPAPYRSGPAGIVSAALVYADGPGVTVTGTARNFSLQVPAGVLAAPAAWATVTEAGDFVTDLGEAIAVADMTIHGDWAGHVGVTTPRVGFSADGFVDVVVHYPSGGQDPEIYGPDLTEADATSITANVTSLSPVHGFLAPLTYFSGPSATTSPQTARTVADTVWDFTAAVLDFRTDAPVCPRSDVTYDFTASVTGFMVDDHELLHCHYVTGDDGRLRAEMRNNRNVVVSGRTTQIEGTVRFTDGFGGAPATPAGFAIQNVLGIGNTSGVFHAIAPGGSFQVQIDPTAGQTDVRLEVNDVATAVYVLSGPLLDAFLPKTATTQTAIGVVECFYPILANSFYSGGLSGTGAVANLYDCIQPHLAPSLEALGKEAVGALLTGVLLKLNAGVSLFDAIDNDVQEAVAFFSRNNSALVSYLVNDQPDQQPTTDQYGRPVLDECLSGGGTTFDPRHGYPDYVLDEACQNSAYDRDPGEVGNGSVRPAGPDGTIGDESDGVDYVMYAIEGGRNPAYFRTTGDEPAYGVVPADYPCMAARYPLRDWLPTERVFDYNRQVHADPAFCPQVVLPLRVQADATNWILRRSTGEAVFIDADGIRHPLTTGGAYIDCAQRYLVLDYRSTAELTQFPLGTPDHCP